MSFASNLLLFSPLLILGIIFLLGREIVGRLKAVFGSKGKKKEEDFDDHKPQDDEKPTATDSTDDSGGESESSEGNNDETDDDAQYTDEFEIIGQQGSSTQFPPTDGPSTEMAPTAGPSTQTLIEADNASHAIPAGNGAPDRPNQPALHIPQTRVIGKKKAASLARRDQRRAYNEFIQSRAQAEAEANRALEEELAEVLFEERRRRALVEEEINFRKAEDRRMRLEVERADAAARGWVKEEVDTLKRRVLNGEVSGLWKVSDLAGLRTEKWVSEAFEREGMLGYKDLGQEGRWVYRMVTGKGMYAVFGNRDIDDLWLLLEKAGDKGLKWVEIAEGLKDILTLHRPATY